MLTDNEIITAFQCYALADNYSSDCINCSYCGAIGFCENFRLFKDVLDLIFRLKGESNKYRNLSQAHKAELRRVYPQIAEQKAEIERLQKAGDEAVSCFIRMESLYKIKCKELDVAKTEAIKEFAERLKEINNNRGWFCGVYNHDIDNLVKEMAEGEQE